MSTYDYIVAQREKEEQKEKEEQMAHENLPTPASNAAANSVSTKSIKVWSSYIVTFLIAT